MKFIVIGITDHPQPFFPPEVLEAIKSGKIFSGGKRHHEIVAPLLPKDAVWIDITAPLDAVFDQYAHLSRRSHGGSKFFTLHSSLFTIIVFASGDPLFFGFANTIRRKLPEADIKVYPSFNSLQLLAHRLVMPYHDLRIVSLTGRPWPEFDRALIERAPKIGILTDREHTPAAIAQRMTDYGYTDYQMHVGEHLGNPTEEKVTTLSLEEAATRSFATPNCLILHSSLITHSSSLITHHSTLITHHSSLITHHSTLSTHHTPFGIPESDFALLDGREKMITKMPIRLLTLQALDLSRRHVLWDIGACTGSVSIEARLLFPHLQIHAFEIRPECEAIIEENARRHGTPGITLHIGDFLEADLSLITHHSSLITHHSSLSLQPDAVFIGGHGGHLKEIMAKVLTVLSPDGCIVMNSVKAPKVTTDSHQLWDEACRELGLRQDPPTRIILNDNHPIEILKCKKR